MNPTKFIHLCWAIALVLCVSAGAALIATDSIFGTEVVYDCEDHEKEMLEAQVRCQVGNTLASSARLCMGSARESLCKPVRL